MIASSSATIDSILERLTDLLSQLIRTPSFSREEDKTANIIYQYLVDNGISPLRSGNNIWVRSAHWKDGRPVLLLNSHHDTVKPVQSWTMDPFHPTVADNRLYGLGSNDAGGSLVTLLETFLHFERMGNAPMNIIFSATAEEEISGAGGVQSILGDLGEVDMAIVGEPTSLGAATAEKGLVVIDAVARGVSGHAARSEGVNAISIAMRDLVKIKKLELSRGRALTGPVKLTVTQIKAGYQHNVVPDTCEYVIDVRTNENYSNCEVVRILQECLESELKPRSLRLESSGIANDHPLVVACSSIGLETFGSSTLSDQALLPFPSIKLGCGASARSHTADEYIEFQELKEGFETYVNLIENICL